MRRLLTFLAATLVVAFVVLPTRLTVPEPGFRPAFAHWWQLGHRQLTPDLQDYVDYWFRFHVVKGGIAVLLLVVLALLGARVRRSVPAVVAVAGVGLVALAAVLANVQGAVAPFASLLPTLSTDDLRGPAEALRSGQRNPALAAILDDYTLYHAVMIGLGGVVAVAFVVGSVLLWRRASRAAAVCTALLAVAASVLVWANTSVTLDPEPGLLGLFTGGW